MLTNLWLGRSFRSTISRECDAEPPEPFRWQLVETNFVPYLRLLRPARYMCDIQGRRSVAEGNSP